MPYKLTLDLVDQRFGRLVVLSRDGRNKNRDVFWLCQCDCGNQTRTLTHHLTRGGTSSCGCYLKDLQTTHGKAGSAIYDTWQGMIQRCTNPNNNAYSNYGARGITVCDHWLTFENFYEDMGDRPEGYTLERLDNDKGYYPENCVWADWFTQARNRRNTRLIEYEGQSLTLSEWSRLTKIKIGTLARRYRTGLRDKDLFNPDVKLNPYKYGRR